MVTTAAPTDMQIAALQRTMQREDKVLAIVSTVERTLQDFHLASGGCNPSAVMADVPYESLALVPAKVETSMENYWDILSHFPKRQL